MRLVPFGVAAALGFLYAWVLFSSARELEQARLFAERGSSLKAARLYARAVRWYAPANPFAERAAGELFELAEKISREEPTKALRAYRLLRGALLGSRWLLTPGKNIVGRSEERIASLVAGSAGVEGQAPARETVLEELRRPRPPRRGWVALAALAFPAWIGFTLRAVWSGSQEKRRALRSALAAGAAFALWIAGLALA